MYIKRSALSILLRTSCILLFNHSHSRRRVACSQGLLLGEQVAYSLLICVHVRVIHDCRSVKILDFYEPLRRAPGTSPGQPLCVHDVFIVPRLRSPRVIYTERGSELGVPCSFVITALLTVRCGNFCQFPASENTRPFRGPARANSEPSARRNRLGV